MMIAIIENHREERLIGHGGAEEHRDVTVAGVGKPRQAQTL